MPSINLLGIKYLLGKFGLDGVHRVVPHSVHLRAYLHETNLGRSHHAIQHLQPPTRPKSTLNISFTLKSTLRASIHQFLNPLASLLL